MIVLDTNVVSELVRPTPEPSVVAWLEGVTDEVALTAITVAELLAGLALLPDGRRSDGLDAAARHALEPYRGSRAILPFDAEAAGEHAEVLGAHTRSGSPISSADAQIAAVCRVHDATLATRNTKDFEGTGVQLVNPWIA
ncbi:type II toxin-antitoxin system VapC family toxin [Kytococcus sp. HMSC28H12]|uniref:type II toxin-antitoxin system VapC family toxin n=1 Tax=Kytococcus sp. HMSC28H12 TaxID=1581067 RepID=UPI0008A1D589|nr:type II toxin-antitoxin system VapC family toxin [Kytococcus sp. HMSC28H12]OFS06195.1 plasmid stabilization protein [Kytococcus sp. HMSC28H12]